MTNVVEVNVARRWALMAATVLMAAFHIVVDIPLGQVAMRLSAADLILPLALLLLGGCWLAERRPVLDWRHPLVLPGLMAIAIALSVSLAVGWHAQGQISRWALTNKYLGFYVLVGFFLAGALAANQMGRLARERLLRTLFLVGAASAVWSDLLYETMILRIVERVPEHLAKPWHEVAGLIWGDIRTTGWLVNANTFAFMMALLTVLQLPFARRGELFSPRVHTAMVTLYVAALISNGSRAAAGAVLVGLVTLVVLRAMPWRIFIRSLLLGAALALLLNVLPTLIAEVIGLVLTLPRLQAGVLLANSENAWSLATRFEGYRHAWELWLAHPWLGSGLGSFLSAEIARGAQPPQVIHSTWLWLLTEAGPLGLGAVGGFFLAAVVSLRFRAGRDDALAEGMVAGILLFGVMAMAHELMYQRHLWFLLGFVLCRCRGDQRAVTEVR